MDEVVTNMVMMLVAVLVKAMRLEVLVEEVMIVDMTATAVAAATEGMQGAVVSLVFPMGESAGCNSYPWRLPFFSSP
jgi:hypothetical protein